MKPFKQVEENVKKLCAKTDKALKLLDSETADQIIGEQTEEYRTLIQGTEALMTFQWMVMKGYGVRQSKDALKAQAQTLAMVSTLLHYAYALGIQRGREESRG